MWCQKFKKKKEHTLPILEKNVVNWPSLVCTLFRPFVISQYNVNQDTSFLRKKKEKEDQTREQEKKKRNDPSPNKRPHPKVQNAQWGVLRGENTKPKNVNSFKVVSRSCPSMVTQVLQVHSNMERM